MSTETGRGPDRYIFANNEEGGELAEKTLVSLNNAGIVCEAITDTIGGVEVIVVTVTGKRPGEGRIAADMKARKA